MITVTDSANAANTSDEETWWASILTSGTAIDAISLLDMDDEMLWKVIRQIRDANPKRALQDVLSILEKWVRSQNEDLAIDSLLAIWSVQGVDYFTETENLFEEAFDRFDTRRRRQLVDVVSIFLTRDLGGGTNANIKKSPFIKKLTWFATESMDEGAVRILTQRTVDWE